MGLKTNSKKAIDNIWNYIEGFIDEINDCYIAYDPEYNYIQPGSRSDLATYVYHVYEGEKKNNDNLYNAGRITDQELFAEWASGLAMGGMFDFWYYGDTVNLLGEMLEETETEKARYTDTAACEMLTSLIYREIVKNKK